ncbi:MAG TPA: hypothetical protein VGS62_00290, partial [Streptosporangiaceae bacterium]|nr:hypothetical protein [Streptosporangiaceae bacterium]
RGRRTDLLEEVAGDPLAVEDGATTVDLPPCGLASLAFDVAPAAPARKPAPPEQDPAGSGAEPAQPVYTRYWLHGKGPAPAGNLPVAVHIRPGRAALGQEPEDRTSVRVSVACGPEPARGRVELDVPGALIADPAGPLDYDLPARGHAAWEVTVTAAPGARPGRYFLAARIRDGLGQLLEDAALVTVRQPGPPDLSLPLDELLPLIEADQQSLAGEVGLALSAGELTLAPGGRGELAVTVTNRTGSRIRGEAQLVSPYGSWSVIGPWTLGFAADPGGETTIRYPVRVPVSARPGTEWWALVKIMYFGRVRYTSAVRVAVTG